MWVGDYTLWLYPNPPNGDSPLFDIAKVQNKIEKSKCYPEFNIPLTFGLIGFFFLVVVFLLFSCSCYCLNSKRAGEKRKPPHICFCRVVMSHLLFLSFHLCGDCFIEQNHFHSIFGIFYGDFLFPKFFVKT